MARQMLEGAPEVFTNLAPEVKVEEHPTPVANPTKGTPKVARVEPKVEKIERGGRSVREMILYVLKDQGKLQNVQIRDLLLKVFGYTTPAVNSTMLHLAADGLVVQYRGNPNFWELKKQS